MICTEEIADAVSRRYGLMSRKSWPEEIDAAVSKIAKLRECAPEQVSVEALSDEALLREITCSLTVVETYFMRHTHHFGVLADFVRDRVSSPHSVGHVRVLSAGCGTGEEPYSIAIALLGALGAHASKCEILGIDLDSDAIAAARKAVYRPWAFRGTSPAFRASYFNTQGEPPDQRYQLMDRIRARVRFESNPILPYLCASAPHSIDAIFFRNVSIYLDEETFVRVTEGFHRVLKPGGLLVTSPADRIPSAEHFERHVSPSTSSYRATIAGQRAAGSTGQPRRPRLDQGARATEASPRSRRPARAQPRPRVNRAPAKAAALAPDPVAIGPASGAAAASALAEILELGGRREINPALERVNEIVVAEPDNAGAYLVRGQLHFATDQLEHAVEDLRRAVFLDGEDHRTRLWFAMALSSSGRVKKAQLQLRELERRLDGAQGSSKDPGLGELRDAVARMLEA